MKKLILQLIVCAAALLPVAEARTYGDFAPGKVFTLNVTDVDSSKTEGTRVIARCPIPAGMPKFTKGQRVRFEIGARGQLTGPGFSIKFLPGGVGANAYVNLETVTNPNPNIATIYKSSTNRPTGGVLIFYKWRLSGFTPIVNTVAYTLD